MALRRPASTRSRLNNVANPTSAPPPRSRSVMSRSASIVQPNDDSQQTEPTHVLKHSRPASSEEDFETNIQVVIRCRGRSEREILDNSPIIVASTGVKSKDVSIEVSAPISSLGLITLPPIRTYPFDLVFGPEADQAMIYHEVVSPMLEEVLMGYNCTLFAYGQTGTGKTYTMHGDLNPTPMGNPSADAGMIPRVLFRLFHHLEKSKSDYSVKISYIELYNEELRDLLANDFSAPNGSTQPMGMGGKDANKMSDNGLKIFDDTSKRGVTIQGLEEIVVKDSQAALALLTKGSHRRQIAATKFNDHSSRSHSVFSITVHVKEPSIAGEDLLKVGKLNLVDLAGSENIGRSGAENKRAREAGMINQSLLTLGRVINALVDKASHIPYRESKLTRLLQDSLGGRTKTCIIGTISPARSNLEETLSTLDYAIRAKSIRNKPELNQRTTRNSLIKDYVAEIERLKADLVAAREKNGIFFSEETWAQMTVEQELKTTELEEAKARVEIVEGQMRGVREEFEQSIGLLKIRERELRDARKKIQDTGLALQRKEKEFAVTRVALEEETIVRTAHQDTERVLDQVANGLKKVAKESLKNIESLFKKLERKTQVLNSNSEMVLTQGALISRSHRELSDNLDNFICTTLGTVVELRIAASELQTRELDTLASNSSRLDRQIQCIQEALDVIHAKDASEAQALGIVQNVMSETFDTLQVGFATWVQTLTETCNDSCRHLESATMDAFESVEKTLTAVVSLVDRVVHTADGFVRTELTSVHEAIAIAAKTSEQEMCRLRKQNETLSELLAMEKINASLARDALIERISGLLGAFTVERDQSLREAVGAIQEENREGEEEIRAFAAEHNSIMAKIEINAANVSQILQHDRAEGKRTRDGTFKMISTAKNAVIGEVEKMKNTLSSSTSHYSAHLQKHSEMMSLSSTNAFEEHSRAKRARIEATASMCDNVQSDYKHAQNTIACATESIESGTGQVITEATKLRVVTESYKDIALTNLATLHSASEALSEGGAQEDIVTGNTPSKRNWDYVDRWSLTKPRDVILKTWREQGNSNANAVSDTFLADHVPLPEDDSMEEDLKPLSLSPYNSEQENAPPIPASAQAIPVRPPSKLGHRTVLSIDTLTDARNVYTNRAPRRAR